VEDKKLEKQILVLFVLCLVILGVWFRVILSKRVPRSLLPPQTEEKSLSGKGVFLSSGELKTLQKGRTKKEWDRNPFLAIGQEKEATYLLGLSLTGILWDEEKPLAMINNVVVGVSDTIDHYTVKEISSDTVLLERDGEPFVLHLGAKEGRP